VVSTPYQHLSTTPSSAQPSLSLQWDPDASSDPSDHGSSLSPWRVLNHTRLPYFYSQSEEWTMVIKSLDITALEVLDLKQSRKAADTSKVYPRIDEHSSGIEHSPLGNSRRSCSYHWRRTRAYSKAQGEGTTDNHPFQFNEINKTFFLAPYESNGCCIKLRCVKRRVRNRLEICNTVHQ
jgi:hypothetical protein